MPAHRKPKTGPTVKACEACGCIIYRPKRAHNAAWARRRTCSLSCSSKIGNVAKKVLSDSAEDRFWSRVDKTRGQGRDGNCWEWRAGRLIAGYGRFAVDGGEQKAHRYSYMMANGPIPDGMCVCHHCDNPPCVNPAHLFIGYHQDNSDDKVAKKRHLYGETNRAAKLTEGQVRDIIADPRMQIEIAADYGMTQGMVGQIKRGEAWKHVPRL